MLTGVSLHAHPGEMIALVGPTGAGKSTLVNLLPAFYEATAGRILIDGQDIRGISLDSLRDHISVVSQFTLPLQTPASPRIEVLNPPGL